MRFLVLIAGFLWFSAAASDGQQKAAELFETIRTVRGGDAIFKPCCIEGASASELVSGEFVVVDNDEVVLAEYTATNSFETGDGTLEGFGGRGFFTDNFRGPRFFLINDIGTESLALVGKHFGTALEYESPNCAGAAYTDYPGYLFGPVDGKFFVGISQSLGGPASRNIVVRSTRDLGGVRSGNNPLQILAPGECVQREYGATSRYRVVEYTPAPEILNAAYPVRLEQLP